MPNENQYLDALVTQRSIGLDPETALEGGSMLSLETQTDLAESDVLTCIEDNFPEFLASLRCLSAQEQELVLSYYVLSKTQASLAPIHGENQSRCGEHIRTALQKIGAFIMTGAVPVKPKRGRPRAAKQGRIHYKDAAVLGQFRMAVEAPGFDQVFTGHADL